MPRQWTDEQRQTQAERCQQLQPWKHSTGPKSVAGKRKVSQNPRKSASYEMAEALNDLAYWHYDATGDYAGYRQLCYQASLMRRRLYRSFKPRSRIEPWKPPKRDEKGSHD